MKPIRILNLFTILNRGGAESMVMNYYRNIDRSKVQFDFMVHRAEKGFFEEEIESLGGKIFRMPAIRPQNILSYKKKIRLFFEQHSSYAIIHSHMSELGYYVFKEAQKRGVSVRILHAHNVPVFTQLNMFEKIKWIPRIYYRNKSRSLATDFFMCSKVAGNWLHGVTNESKFVLMNNAIDLNIFQFDKTISAEIRKTLKLTDKTVIGHVGRFNTQKNHNFLIDIFELYVKNIDKNAVLVLTGDGVLFNGIKQKVTLKQLENNVLFLGVQDNIPHLLQAFDLFLFPSLYEGLPVSVIEAQAAGLPCVVSSNVTKEVALSSAIEFVSLDQPAHYWVQIIEKILENKRNTTSIELKDAGYDIAEKALWLQNFYLNKMEK